MSLNVSKKKKDCISPIIDYAIGFEFANGFILFGERVS